LGLEGSELLFALEKVSEVVDDVALAEKEILFGVLDLFFDAFLVVPCIDIPSIPSTDEAFVAQEDGVVGSVAFFAFEGEELTLFIDGGRGVIILLIYKIISYAKFPRNPCFEILEDDLEDLGLGLVLSGYGTTPLNDSMLDCEWLIFPMAFISASLVCIWLWWPKQRATRFSLSQG